MENTPENRAGIRKTFFSTPKLNSFIGGVILHDETIRCADTIKPLNENKIILGIKTDGGLAPLEGGEEGEQTTKGLDTLEKRSTEYYKLGALFAKWRSVLKIGDKMPSGKSMQDVADVLANYAIISQKCGLVPIIEPEVMQDGSHDIAKSKEITEKIIKMTLDLSAEKGVHMPGALLKVNMVTKGAASAGEHDPAKVAEMTVDALKNGIGSHKLGGVVFLSGGLSEIDSAKFLNMINAEKAKKKVLANIPLHFSFARALQKSAISLYTAKKPDGEVQAALLHRCKMNHLATQSKYNTDSEGEYAQGASASNFVANNNY